MGAQGVTTGILLPLELAVLLCAGVAAVGAWAAQVRVNHGSDPKGNPLDDVLRAENLAKIANLAARRDTFRVGSHAVLHGRIHPVAGSGSAWDSDQMRTHVAAVMRAGLRQGDSFAAADGGSFTISLLGADECAGLRIADRRGRSIAQMRLPHSDSAARPTATIEVAGGRSDDGDKAVGQRARRALDAALVNRTEHVVSAISMNEILLLPAPAPSPAAATAA